MLVSCWSTWFQVGVVVLKLHHLCNQHDLMLTVVCIHFSPEAITIWTVNIRSWHVSLVFTDKIIHIYCISITTVFLLRKLLAMEQYGHFNMCKWFSNILALTVAIWQWNSESIVLCGLSSLSHPLSSPVCGKAATGIMSPAMKAMMIQQYRGSTSYVNNTFTDTRDEHL